MLLEPGLKDEAWKLKGGGKATNLWRKLEFSPYVFMFQREMKPGAWQPVIYIPMEG